MRRRGDFFPQDSWERNLGVHPDIHFSAFTPTCMYLTPLFSASCVPFVVVFVLGCGVKGFYLGFFLFSFHTRGGGEADSRPVPLRQIKHCHHPFLPQSSTLSITLTAGPSLPRQVTPLWYAAHVVPFPTSTACIPTAYVGYNNIGLIFIAFFSFFFLFYNVYAWKALTSHQKYLMN